MQVSPKASQTAHVVVNKHISGGETGVTHMGVKLPMKGAQKTS